MSGQRDGFALGVDLGTSNTVAVLRRPDGCTRPLLVDGQPILPSGVYAGSDGRLHVGRDALRLAQADPDRYEPNPKRRVDEPDVPLGDRRYAPAELLAAILRAVGEAAVGAVGFLPSAVVTCPATWDAGRRLVLADALALAGWPPAAEHTLSGPIPPGTRLLREPVAAARYYTEVLRRPVPVGEAVAVFDFGGGTLDVTVVRNEGADPWGDSGFTVVSCGGLDDLGGLDLDAALLSLVGERIAPAHEDRWARLVEPADTQQWRDRLQLVENVRGAKEMLSRTAVAPVPVPGVPAAVPLTRTELERVATPLLRRAVDETRRVIAEAGFTPERLAGLFLVGGSSRIPLVARLLHAELGVAPTVLEQPELPVAEGALTDLPLRRNQRAANPSLVGPTPAAPRADAAAAGTLPLESASPSAAGPTVPNTVPLPQDAPLSPAQPVSPPGGTLPGLGPAGTLPAGVPLAGTGTPVLPAAAAPGGPPPAGHLPAGHPAAGIPRQAGPWPGGPEAGRPGVPGRGMPGSPAAPSGGRGRRRTLGISLAAVIALAGVATAAVLYPTRDRHPELTFQVFGKGYRVAVAEERPSDMFTAMTGDRAYLAYPREDRRLTVIAVETRTRKELWRRESSAPADRWRDILALPTGVALLADAYGSSPPELEVLDAGSRDRRWHRTLHRDDALFVGSEVLILSDREGKRLVGLDLRDGTERWPLADLTDEYGNSRTSVYPVTTEESVSGPAYAGGAPVDPAQAPVSRLVQISADRSARLVDAATGEVVRRWTGVAEPDDLVAAHEDRLYVAGDDRRLLAYDLTTSGEPDVYYTAPDGHRAKALVPCGEHRACLLEVTNGDDESAEVVAATEGTDERWKAPGTDRLVPVGERVLARRTYPEPTVTLFGPDGKPVLNQEPGVAVRIDAGNLLLFAHPLTGSEDDRSAAGVGAESGRIMPLRELRAVRGDSCSWNTELIICGSEKDFVIHRFAAS